MLANSVDCKLRPPPFPYVLPPMIHKSIKMYAGILKMIGHIMAVSVVAVEAAQRKLTERLYSARI